MSLDLKAAKYLEWIQPHLDEDGFVDHAHCDSLLFTGLLSIVPQMEPNIDAAFDGTLWHRRPVHRACFPNHSKSTISRDMLVGLAWYCWTYDRKDIATQVVDYALRHWGIMGKAVNLSTKLGRCFIGFGLLSTFAKLSGKWYFWPLTLLPADIKTSTLPTGYAAHIQVLHVLLRCIIDNKDPRDNQILLSQAVREPLNPLFNIAVGNYQKALDTLQNTALWPSDRLPNAKDRKESWLPQRDFGEDWFPAKSNEIHHGGDYIFCYWLLNELKARKWKK